MVHATNENATRFYGSSAVTQTRQAIPAKARTRDTVLGPKACDKPTLSWRRAASRVRRGGYRTLNARSLGRERLFKRSELRRAIR